MKHIVKFKKWTCVIQKEKYQNNRTALCLVDCKSGEDVLMATVNVPELPLKADEVFIKNYSENEGVLSVLVKANIISEPFRYEELNLVIVPVCKLLI
jgi:hypothetical protein